VPQNSRSVAALWNPAEEPVRIVVAAEIDFPPENRSAVLTGAKELIARALEEKGCRHYTWTPDVHHPGRVHVFEEWDSAEDLEAHFAGAPYKNMAAHLYAHTILEAKARKYRVDLVEDIYTPEGVPSARFSGQAR
jgi:quinol monooxygenase YgiN